MKTPILIEGAGIAGLTLANALEQQGIDYLILEKEPSLHAIGAGIAVQANGLAILKALGMDADLPGIKLQQMCLQGRGFRQVLNGDDAWPTRMMTRAALQQLLLTPVAHRVVAKAEVAHADVHTQGIALTLKDGRHYEAALSVQASGIHRLGNEPSELRDSGQWCWRALIPGPVRPEPAGQEWWLGRHRLGLSPVDEGLYYIYHVMSQAGPEQDSQRQAFLQQSPVAQVLTAENMASAQWLSHPLKDKPIHWGQPRRIAIGDCAHALTPNMGQGAVLGMEDAYLLAMLLGQNLDRLGQPALWQDFVKRRHTRVARIRQQSWYFGQVAHWQNPWVTTLRDRLMAIAPGKRMIRQQQKWLAQFCRQMQPLGHTASQ